MAEYTATLPPEFSHLTIDEKDARFIGAQEFAKANNFTAQQWSSMLAIEARGVVARQAAATPAAALHHGLSALITATTELHR
jgi:hypothetical protein